MSKKKRVIIAHGYADSPANVWIKWLGEELTARGFEVSIPVLPNPRLPRLERWLETLGEAAGELDKNTTLVAYSLGTPTTLRMLDNYPKEVRIAGLVLVAAFGDGIRERPGALFSPPLDFERIMRRVRHRVVIHSDNDRVISPRRSQQLAEWLDAREVVVPGEGHFMGGKLLPKATRELPEALEAVLEANEPAWKRRLQSLLSWARLGRGSIIKRTKERA